MSTCTQERGRKLVDARFARTLTSNERETLERHLVSCAACNERYRRLQLADRVLAVGPEGDLEVPSPVEIERIAVDLGLLDNGASGPRRKWIRFRPHILALSAALATATAALVLSWGQMTTETVHERGDAANVPTFGAFIIDGEGQVRPHRPHEPVDRTEHFKLRLSWPEGAPSNVEIDTVLVALVGSNGEVSIASLRGPARAPSQRSASVPGAVSLSGLEHGSATIYAVGYEGRGDEPGLRIAIGRGLDGPQLRATLGARAVARFELSVEEEDPP